MFRESLQFLACLSMLTSTNSLHMARDAFRRPPQLSDIDAIELSEENVIKTATNHHRSLNSGGGVGDDSSGIVVGTISNSVNSDINRMPLSDNIYNRQINDVRNNDIEQNINRPLHRQDAPRALQELFAGPSTLDIRLEQQQRRLLEQQQQQQKQSQQKQQQQQSHQQDNEEQHQSKRAQSSGISGSGGGGGSGGGNGGGGIIKTNLAQVSHGIASQLMLRSPRGQRNYDVPQIGKSIF